MENFNKEIRETFGEKFENVNTLIQKADTYKEETNKQMDHSVKNLDETLNSTSEGTKEDPNALLSENKNFCLINIVTTTYSYRVYFLLKLSLIHI